MCWLGDGRLVFSGFWVFVLVERRSSLAVPWWCPPETGPFTEACEGVEFVEASLKGLMDGLKPIPTSPAHFGPFTASDPEGTPVVP